MSKGKQTTLFQTWGYEGNPNQSTSQDDGPPNKSTNAGETDLFSDDDEMLAQVMEQSLIEYQSTQGTRSVEPSAAILESSATLLEHLPGFDVSAGATWIYPTNYPVREYQFEIVKSCLFQNTLVCLPTGLGKTLIAAVVMYNFYRWYPQGKIVFMAPTKPLVGQQIEACFNIMGIPQEDTMEMTGSVSVAKRKDGWKDKRVFFLTPQVMSNDLSRGLFPARDVKLLVVDEAHKAQGDYAYCLVARELARSGSNFRVMALSATPGNDIEAVKSMLKSLYISYIELRSEDSPDVTPYTHDRKLEKIVIPMSGEILEIKGKFLSIMEIYTNRLSTAGAIRGNHNPTNFTKFAIIEKRNEFRQNPPDGLTNKGMVEADLATLISLYHAYDLLLIHGMRSFYKFLTKETEEDRNAKRIRAEIGRIPQWRDILAHLTEKFSNDVSISKLNLSKPNLSMDDLTAQPGGEEHEMALSHPKLDKLRDIVVEHFKKFKQDGKDTRVMIFSQFRVSVDEIIGCLLKFRPLVKPKMFVGQAGAAGKKGLTQKEQIAVVKNFREGGYNTLVATCVGEEGLDIGEVDLIICFDVTNSPIQMVQRMGRTGRKREGRIVVLVSQGKEENTYNRNMFKKKTINKAILEKDRLATSLYDNSPRMVPRGLEPKCLKMKMIVNEFQGRDRGKGGSGGGKGQVGLSGMLKKVNKYDVFRTNCGFLSQEETERWGQLYKFVGSVKTLGKSREAWAKKKEDCDYSGNDGTTFNLADFHLWQKADQHRKFVGPGKLSATFSKILAVVGDPTALAAAVSASQAAHQLAEPPSQHYVPSNREEDLLDKEKSLSKNNIFNYFKPKIVPSQKKKLTKIVDLTVSDEDDDFEEEDTVYVEKPVAAIKISNTMTSPKYNSSVLVTPIKNNNVGSHGDKKRVIKSQSPVDVVSPETKLVQELFEDCDSGLGADESNPPSPVSNFQNLIDNPPTQKEVESFDVQAAIERAKSRIYGKHIKKLDSGILRFYESKQIAGVADIIAMPSINNQSMEDLFDDSENDSFFHKFGVDDGKNSKKSKNYDVGPIDADDEFDKQTQLAIKRSLEELENKEYKTFKPIQNSKLNITPLKNVQPKITPIKDANETANFDLGSPFVSPQNSQGNNDEVISSPVLVKNRVSTDSPDRDTLSALPLPSKLVTKLNMQSSTPLPGKCSVLASFSRPNQPQDLTPISHRERNATSVMRNAPTAQRNAPSLGRDFPLNTGTSPCLASKARKGHPLPSVDPYSTPPLGTSHAKLTDDMFGSSDDEIFNMIDEEERVPVESETIFSATQLVSMVNKTSSANSEIGSHVKKERNEKPVKKLSDVFASAEHEEREIDEVRNMFTLDTKKAVTESFKDSDFKEKNNVKGEGKKERSVINQDDDINAMFDLSLSDDMFASQEAMQDPKVGVSGNTTSNLLPDPSEAIFNESSNLLSRENEHDKKGNTEDSYQSENLLDKNDSNDSLDLLLDDDVPKKSPSPGPLFAPTNSKHDSPSDSRNNPPTDSRNNSPSDSRNNPPTDSKSDPSSDRRNNLPPLRSNIPAKSCCPVCNVLVEGDMNIHLDLCLNGALLDQLSQENSDDEVRPASPRGNELTSSPRGNELTSPVLTGRRAVRPKALETSDEDSPVAKRSNMMERKSNVKGYDVSDESPIGRGRARNRGKISPVAECAKRSSSEDDSPIARGRVGRRNRMVLSSQMIPNDSTTSDMRGMSTIHSIRGMSTIHSISRRGMSTIHSISSSSSDTMTKPVMVSDDSLVEPEKTKKKKRTLGREFLEHEASVSGEDSGDDEEEDDDKYDESFVDDASQSNVDQYQYLRSVNSPTFKHPAGRPRKMRPITADIFSQVPQEDDTNYEEDSFCVGSQEVEYDTEMDTLDMLDNRAEKGTSFKRKRSDDSSGKGKKKRKRILNMSSDDETALGSTLLRSPPREKPLLGSPLLKIPLDSKEDGERQERLRKQKQKEDEFQQNHQKKKIETETVVENFFDPTDFDDDFESQDLAALNSYSDVANDSKVFLKPDLTDSINAAEKVTVIVATGEVNKVPEIISNLKHTHGCNVKVMSSLAASFILSQRMCAHRVMEADFSSGTYRTKLLERLVAMREQYEKVLLIVESEKIKPGERAKKVTRTKYLDRTVAELCHTRVQVMHTSSQLDTAAAMADCATREAEKKFGLPFASVNLMVSQEEMVEWYSKLPGVGLGAAIYLAVVFPTIRDVVTAQLETLMSRGNLGRERAGELVKFFTREFQPDLTDFEPL